MKTLDEKSIIGITALLINAAKIDEQYSEHEKELIKQFIKSYIKDKNDDEIPIIINTATKIKNVAAI